MIHIFQRMSLHPSPRLKNSLHFRLRKLTLLSVIFYHSFQKLQFIISLYFKKYAKKNTSLSVSYNIFDGEELLLDSLVFFRSHADHISVIYQTIGNTGLAHPNPNFEKYLRNLQKMGLIDDLHKYDPNLIEFENTYENYAYREARKRTIGVEIARNKGHTHFMPLDNDEFYLPFEFMYMKHILMSKRNKKTGAIKHLQYYRSNSLVVDPPEQEYIATISPISDDLEYMAFSQAPIPIDPGRKPRDAKYRIFFRFEIQMHHMSYVRTNLVDKLRASQASLGNLDFLEEIVLRYQNYRFPEKGLWAHRREVNLRQVNPVIPLHNFNKLPLYYRPF